MGESCMLLKRHISISKVEVSGKIPGRHGSLSTSSMHDQVMMVAWTSATLMLPIFFVSSLAERIC